MAIHANPVGRLYSFLLELKKIPSNITLREVWPVVLATTPASDRELLFEFNEIIKLIEAGKNEVRGLSNIDTDLFIGDLVQVEQALCHAFIVESVNSSLSNLFKTIDEGVMKGLLYISSALEIAGFESAVDVSQTESLRNEVESLISDILESELDQKLKIHLVEALELVRKSIVNFQIYGPEGLRRSLDNTISILLRNREDLTEVYQHENGPLIDRLFTTIKSLDNLVAVALKVKQLASPVIDFLKLGSGS